MLGVVATAADAMPDTLPDASAATATASNVSGAAGLPMATKNPARIAAATGMQTNFHGLLAVVAPLGGDEWLGGDGAMAVSTLQPTAVCHALASEHQPAHSSTSPRPPSQSLTIPSAGAPLGGEVTICVDGDSGTVPLDPPTLQSTAAYHGPASKRQTARTSDPPRPPPQHTTHHHHAPMGGDFACTLALDARPLALGLSPPYPRLSPLPSAPQTGSPHTTRNTRFAAASSSFMDPSHNTTPAGPALPCCTMLAATVGSPEGAGSTWIGPVQTPSWRAG